MNTFRKSRSKFRKPIVEDSHRINDKITAREVRVIDDKGEQLGILQTQAAIAVAEEKGLDLVEVAPKSRPPVCRLMDYGKFKYKEQKKEAEAKKKRLETSTKEIRIRYRTDSGDLETKLKRATGFILNGDKVKFSMRFKGREIMYVDLGLEKFKEIAKALEEVAVIDDQSKSASRQIYITFAPTKEVLAKVHQQHKEATKEKKHT